MNALKAFLSDTKVRAALVALVMAVAAYFGFGCGAGLNATQVRAAAAHACYFQALEPVLGPLTEEFLKAALAGGDLAKALIVHGVPVEDVAQAAAAFERCGREAVQRAAPQLAPASSALVDL